MPASTATRWSRLADAVAATGSAEHAAEEAEHIGLWDQFAAAAGAAGTPSRDRRRASASSRGRRGATPRGARGELRDRVGQPAISRTKLDGLVGQYGFEEGPATEYFSLHATLDEQHAAESRELIEGSAERGSKPAAGGSRGRDAR